MLYTGTVVELTSKSHSWLDNRKHPSAAPPFSKWRHVANLPCPQPTRDRCALLRFVNVGFTVRSGANIVFDMPKTLFGPNTEVSTVKAGSKTWHGDPSPVGM